jgi:hypothetical protein
MPTPSWESKLLKNVLSNILELIIRWLFTNQYKSRWR